MSALFKFVYSIKHKSIKVSMKISSSRLIETDYFKSTTFDLNIFDLFVDILDKDISFLLKGCGD